MTELVVVALDEASEAHAVRAALEDAHGLRAILLDPVALEKKPAARARRWLGLPWRATKALAVGSLTAIAWTTLVMGAISGEMAGWLMDRQGRDGLPKELAGSVPREKVNLILYADAEVPVEALKVVQELGGQIWRPPLRVRDMEWLRAALEDKD